MQNVSLCLRALWWHLSIPTYSLATECDGVSIYWYNWINSSIFWITYLIPLLLLQKFTTSTRRKWTFSTSKTNLVIRLRLTLISPHASETLWRKKSIALFRTWCLVSLSLQWEEVTNLFVQLLRNLGTTRRSTNQWSWRARETYSMIMAACPSARNVSHIHMKVNL